MHTYERTASRPIADNGTLPDVVLSARDVSFAYNGEDALEAVTFDVRTRDRVAIIGPNGAGKSTLMKLIMGLLRPASGTIAVRGGGRRLGYVPQQEPVNWNFPVTVRDAVMMGRARHIGWLRWPGAPEGHIVDAALARVEMSHLADRQVGELSGGQRRRVFIARALAQEADVLILDEPFSGVDSRVQAGLMDVLATLNADGMTILLTTHDLNLAFGHFDYVMALHRRMIAFGPPHDVYTPTVLEQVYGGRLATWDDGRQVMLFVDDTCHAC